MALTKISTDGVKDDAITKAKIPANQVETSELANDCVTNAQVADNAIQEENILDQQVTLAKLPHGDSNNDGKFLRANNGADPSFETVDLTSSFNKAGGDTITGDFTIASGTTNKNINVDVSDKIKFDDDLKATFGNSDDLEIYHKSADNGNYIESQNGRNLFLEQDQIFVLDETGNEYMIHAVANGAVSLYHANTKQCETSANGLAFPSGKGIDFSATGDSGGMSNEVFDDYEEGTWTPSITGWDSFNPYSGSAYRLGWYRKVGNLCHVGWKIYISTVSTPSTNPHIHVTGLPHAAVSVQAGPVAHVRFDITEFGFSGYPVPYLSGNDTIIGMYYHGEGHGYLTGVNATGTRQNVWCMGSATYATN